MTQDPKYIEKLVHKFNNGSINTDELHALANWYTSHSDNEVTIPLTEEESSDHLKARVLNGLLKKINEDKPKGHYRVRKFYWIAAAAVLIAFIGLWTNEVYIHKEVASPVISTKIEPGGNKATLTLADGSQINLSNAQDGIVMSDGISYNDGTRVTDDGSLKETHGTAPKMVLQTPRGGTYQITLPDGTQVWLNAASSLKYPTYFKNEQRIVELDGEAYFNVTSAYRKDGSKVPFKVVSKQQDFEVLGTQFNISAYADQSVSKTTLIEGKIAIADKQKRIILSPGSQAITNQAGTRLQEVNVSNHTAWRDGKFSFDGKSFAEVMTEIGHWYDLTIAYEGKVPTVELAGDAFRNQNIGLVLRVLDVADINYSLDTAKRKLIIKGKKI